MRISPRSLAFPNALIVAAALFSVTAGQQPAAASPGNDDFANAVALPETATGSASASNLDATVQAGEPSPPGDSTTHNTLWWSWKAPSSGKFLFDTCGSTVDTTIGIYTGSAVDDLAEQSTGGSFWCKYRQNWAYDEERYIDAVDGTTYYLQVGSDSAGMGQLHLNWTNEVVPGNDNFSSAEELTGNTGHVTIGNQFASRETGEPNSTYGGPTVWWYWTPPADGTYRFDTCGSDFRTTIGIYTAVDPGAPAVNNLNEGVFDAEGHDCPVQSNVTLTSASTSETYYIVVGGQSAQDVGTIVLNWTNEAPGNDDLASAIAITGSSGTEYVSSRMATAETGEPTTTGGSSVWWRWHAPSTGLVEFDTCGSDFTTDLSAYTGDDVAALTLVVSSGLFSCMSQGRIMFAATAGSYYDIAVGYGQGDVVLRYQMGTPPSNDDFANATPLQGAGGTLIGTNMFATREAGEDAGLGTNSIWYSWMAPATGETTFDTCGSSTRYTILAIVSGGSVATPAYDQAVNSGCNGQAILTPYVEAGQVYHLRVDTSGGDMGTVVLHWPASGVPVAPTMTGQPSDTTVAAGDTAYFTAGAAGFPAPTVEWDVEPAGSSSWSPVEDATGTTLELSTDYTMNGNRYRAVFTNGSGSVTSDSALLTVTPIAPHITVDPVSKRVTVGDTVELTAAASGNPAPTVEWKVSTDGGGTWNPTGVTEATYGFTAGLAMDGYQYEAVFHNAGGDATSAVATLRVFPLPTGASVTNLVAAGAKGKITVTFTAGGPSSQPFTEFECSPSGKGSKHATWTTCASGWVYKGSASSVSVRGGYLPDGPWADTVSIPVTTKTH